MKRLFLYTILMIAFLLVRKEANAQRFVQVIGDENLDSLVEENISKNREHPEVQGYRVQIFFGSDRKSANEARTKFLNRYPEEEVYLIYQQPYFKVRVGDYRTALEAQAMYRKVMHDFDKIFIIPDKINMSKL